MKATKQELRDRILELENKLKEKECKFTLFDFIKDLNWNSDFFKIIHKIKQIEKDYDIFYKYGICSRFSEVHEIYFYCSHGNYFDYEHNLGSGMKHSKESLKNFHIGDLKELKEKK
jgi:hypothetical protein